MVKRQVMFTFPSELLTEPVIYNIGQQFNIVTIIRQAHLTEDRGWIILELNGEDKDIEAGIAWVISRGIRVEAIGDDTIEI